MTKIRIDSQGRIITGSPWPPVGILLSAALLVALALGSYGWARQFLDSVYGYRSPLQGQPPAGEPATPLTQQVVLVIVDGLRYDTMQEIPPLQSLGERGARAKAMAAPPTASQPTWTTLVSGAGPEINGAALLNAPDDEIQPLAVDNLFVQAKRAGLTSGLVGSRWWGKMVPVQLLDMWFFPEGAGEAADAQVAQAAVYTLQNLHPNFLLIHLDQVDEVGHAAGAASEVYHLAARRVGDHIADIAAAMDLAQGVLIVTADHGHLDKGGHGGAEEGVVTTPFIMVGQGVRPGDYGQIEQADVAPTIAALLGTAIPSAAQGRILFDMLAMGPQQRAEKAVALAQQRVALGDLYLRSLASEVSSDVPQEALSEAAPGDVQVARSALEIGNYDSAFQLAGFAVERADAEMEEARARRLAEERRRRLPLTLAAILLPLYPLWRKASPLGGWLLVAALPAFLGPLGNGPALQSIASTWPLVGVIVERAAIALALGAAVVLGWLWQGRSRQTTAIALALLIALLGSYTLFARQSYSPSAIRGLIPFLKETAGRAAIALALGTVVVLIGLWRERVTPWRVVGATYGYALILAYLLIVQLAVCYLVDGFMLTWYLPNVDIAFLHFSTLAQLGAVAALSLVWPLVTLVAYEVILAMMKQGGGEGVS
ncbi:MAG: alkaline phosphatase family protein [Anaerolineae bacterium]